MEWLFLSRTLVLQTLVDCGAKFTVTTGFCDKPTPLALACFHTLEVPGIGLVNTVIRAWSIQTLITVGVLLVCLYVNVGPCAATETCTVLLVRTWALATRNTPVLVARSVTLE